MQEPREITSYEHLYIKLDEINPLNKNKRFHVIQYEMFAMFIIFEAL